MTDSWSLQVSDLVHYMSSTEHSDPHVSNLVADYILWSFSIVSIREHVFMSVGENMYTLTHKQMTCHKICGD